jgi:hypothetical protein
MSHRAVSVPLFSRRISLRPNIRARNSARQIGLLKCHPWGTNTTQNPQLTHCGRWIAPGPRRRRVSQEFLIYPALKQTSSQRRECGGSDPSVRVAIAPWRRSWTAKGAVAALAQGTTLNWRSTMTHRPWIGWSPIRNLYTASPFSSHSPREAAPIGIGLSTASRTPIEPGTCPYFTGPLWLMCARYMRPFRAVAESRTGGLGAVEWTISASIPTEDHHSQ